MTYNTLERAIRNAACRTLGAKSKDFDKWLVTCDPNEGIEIEGFDLGTCVELALDPSVSPFQYFASDVVFYVSVHEGDIGDVQVFFGETCQDVESAEAAARDFLDKDTLDGWYIAEDFNENNGLHLMREFDFDSEDESDMESKISSCFAELLENDIADKLRSFIHHFEN